MGGVPAAAQRLQRGWQEIEAVIGEVLVHQWEKNLENPPETHFQEAKQSSSFGSFEKAHSGWVKSLWALVLEFPGNSSWSQLPTHFPLLYLKPEALGICEGRGPPTKGPQENECSPESALSGESCGTHGLRCGFWGTAYKRSTRGPA